MNNAPASGTGLRLSSRIILGALSGMAGTMAMTAAMGRLHRRLPEPQQYPLPPREITELVSDRGPDDAIKDAATAAHFFYGAAAGSLLAMARPRTGPAEGALFGAGIWAASYLGWIPAANILEPADRHPGKRTALMIAAHLIWGTVTALSLHELIVARATMLRAGPLRDAAAPPPSIAARGA